MSNEMLVGTILGAPSFPDLNTVNLCVSVYLCLSMETQWGQRASVTYQHISSFQKGLFKSFLQFSYLGIIITGAALIFMKFED